MKRRHLICRFLLPAVLVFGLTTAPPVRADVVTPWPNPAPKPPAPQPPLPPDPNPDPDDGESKLRSVVVASAAGVGLTLLGVWVIRRQLRRRNPVGQLS